MTRVVDTPTTWERRNATAAETAALRQYIAREKVGSPGPLAGKIGITDREP